MQEFNKITTTSNFIKELLYQTYLPVNRTVQAGDYVVQGHTYIYKCEIIKVTSSGYVLDKRKKYDLTPVAQYNSLGEYTFAERNGKLCHNFQSNCAGYDSLTHEKLGNYLRALRDMYGLNLMPLYNCFSNNIFANHIITYKSIYKSLLDNGTKIYKIPIRFNTDYTVCIENAGKTTIAPAFIRNENLIDLQKVEGIGSDIDVTNRYISLHTNDVISTYSNLIFSQPIVVRFNNIPEKLQKTYPIINDEDMSKYIIDIKDSFFTYAGTYSELTSEQIATNHYYIQKSVSDTKIITHADGTKEQLDETSYKYTILNSSKATSDTQVYYCSINPSQQNWYEQGTSSITTDTYINTDKTYYLEVATKSNQIYEYDVKDIHCSMFDSVEDHLYMLICVPKEFDNNIVVLEGDYTRLNHTKIYNRSDVKNYPDNKLDKLFTYDLRLLRMNTGVKIPFSDTLVQFLLWHVICNMDSINLDMDRILSQMVDLGMSPDKKYYANYWYYRYRELLSNYVHNNLITYVDDNLGYVTTEVENLLNKGY